MNTEKVAKAMADVLGAKLAKIDEVKPEDLSGYDLIGFGSGIYGGKFHQTLFDLVNKLPAMNKDAFIFSTSAAGKEEGSKAFKEALMNKGFRIVDEFTCLGEFGLGFLVMKNKGHPDEADLEKARTFAKGLMKG